MCFLCRVEARVLGSLWDLTYAHVCTRNRVTKSNPPLNSAHPYCPYVSVTPIHVSGNVKKNTENVCGLFLWESWERRTVKKGIKRYFICVSFNPGFSHLHTVTEGKQKSLLLLCVLFCVCCVCVCLQFIFSCYIVLFTFGQKQCLSTEENSREANIATANETWQRICNFI